ncbi:Transposon TX1 uncharacterized protein [Nymphaea thermarum]|nr:Transposon TX1 uncharacterized protein [Nymphaea thermarum]
MAALPPPPPLQPPRGLGLGALVFVVSGRMSDCSMRPRLPKVVSVGRPAPSPWCVPSYRRAVRLCHLLWSVASIRVRWGQWWCQRCASLNGRRAVTCSRCHFPACQNDRRLFGRQHGFASVASSFWVQVPLPVVQRSRSSDESFMFLALSDFLGLVRRVRLFRYRFCSLGGPPHQCSSMVELPPSQLPPLLPSPRMPASPQQRSLACSLPRSPEVPFLPLPFPALRAGASRESTLGCPKLVLFAAQSDVGDVWSSAPSLSAARPSAGGRPLEILRPPLPSVLPCPPSSPAQLPGPTTRPVVCHSLPDRLPLVGILLDAELGISLPDALAALKLWAELHQVRQLAASPWLLARDFNCLLGPADSSSSVTSVPSMSAFRSFVGEFSLFDVSSTNGTCLIMLRCSVPFFRVGLVSGTPGSVLNFGGSNMNPLWLLSLIGGLAVSMVGGLLSGSSGSCTSSGGRPSPRSAFSGAANFLRWPIGMRRSYPFRLLAIFLRINLLNSRFCHLAASQRRRQMLLQSMDIEGRVFLGDNILPALSVHFQDFYSKPLRFRAPLPDFHVSSLFVSCAISLERPFLHQEIKNAVWALGSGKAPDIDGFPAEFFCTFCDEFASNSILQKEFNQATCVLVPKRPNLMDVTHFRSISILGTSYKIIPKLLSLQLAPVMPTIINPFQVAFVKGLRLQDAVVLANEVPPTDCENVAHPSGF